MSEKTELAKKNLGGGFQLLPPSQQVQSTCWLGHLMTLTSETGEKRKKSAQDYPLPPVVGGSKNGNVRPPLASKKNGVFLKSVPVWFQHQEALPKIIFSYAPVI